MNVSAADVFETLLARSRKVDVVFLAVDESYENSDPVYLCSFWTVTASERTS